MIGLPDFDLSTHSHFFTLLTLTEQFLNTDKTRSVIFSPSKFPYKILFSIIWLINLVSLAYFQGAFEVSEAREGVVTNEIKQFNTWLLPLRHGEVIPSKPPLFHWITAILTYEDHALDNLGLRITSIGSSIICLFLVFIFLNKKAKTNSELSTSPLIAVSCLSSTYGFLQLSIDGRVDMLFNLFFVANLLLLNWILLTPDKNLPSRINCILLGVTLGFGILSRGPLAIVLFFICLFSGLLISNKLTQIKSWLLKDYAAIITIPFLMSAPWYLSSKLLGKPELLSRQLVFENIDRFFGSDKIDGKPVWFYLEHFWTTSLPLGFLIIYLIYQFIKTKEYLNDTEAFKIVKLFSAQFIAIFIFLSLSYGKRKAYLLPLLPIASIISAVLWSQLSYKTKFFSSLSNLRSSTFKLSAGIFVLISMLGIILKFALSIGLNNFTSSSFFLGLDSLTYKSLIIPSITTLLIYFLLSLKSFKETCHPAFLFLIISFQTYLTIPAFFFLTKGESHSFKHLAQEIKTALNQNSVGIIKAKDDESFDSLLFYLNKRASLISLDGPTLKGYYIAREKWLESQDDTFNSLVVRHVTGKRLADDSSRNVVLFEYRSDGSRLSSEKMR